MAKTEVNSDADLDAGAGSVVPRSVGRVLDLLEIVLAEGRCNLTAAADRADLNPSTALRHLRALEARGYLVRGADGAFAAGPTMWRLAAGFSGAAPVERLLATAQPLLDQLAVDCGESAYLAVSDGNVATYVATAESPRAVRHVGWVGQTVPLDGTAVGAALTEPAKCAVRTGAIEPDITAVSRAVTSDLPFDVAVSVIGPAHRMDDATTTAITTLLESTIARLTTNLGTTQDWIWNSES